MKTPELDVLDDVVVVWVFWVVWDPLFVFEETGATYLGVENY